MFRIEKHSSRGTNIFGLYRQVVLLHRWSLEQVWPYLATWSSQSFQDYDKARNKFNALMTLMISQRPLTQHRLFLTVCFTSKQSAFKVWYLLRSEGWATWRVYPLGKSNPWSAGAGPLRTSIRPVTSSAPPGVCWSCFACLPSVCAPEMKTKRDNNN